MADFLTAYRKFIEPNEGGYSNVKNDKGGETYAGIARAFHKTWEGWTIIDMKKSRYKDGVIPRNTKFPDIQFLVERFYRDMWDRNLFGQIHNQDVANLLFDYYVHSGSYAIKAIQKLTGAVTDGVMGPKTIQAINSYPNQARLHDNLKAQRQVFLESLIKADPTQEDFRTGWMARIARFPDLLSPGGTAAVIGIAALALIFFLMLQPTPKPKAA